MQKNPTVIQYIYSWEEEKSLPGNPRSLIKEHFLSFHAQSLRADRISKWVIKYNLYACGSILNNGGRCPKITPVFWACILNWDSFIILKIFLEGIP